jgi:hypothetical protein
MPGQIFDLVGVWLPLFPLLRGKAREWGESGIPEENCQTCTKELESDGSCFECRGTNTLSSSHEPTA